MKVNWAIVLLVALAIGGVSLYLYKTKKDDDDEDNIDNKAVAKIASQDKAFLANVEAMPGRNESDVAVASVFNRPRFGQGLIRNAISNRPRIISGFLSGRGGSPRPNERSGGLFRGGSGGGGIFRGLRR